MDNVMLIGSSYSAMPILIELEKLNFSIIVIGFNKDDPCHQRGHKSFFIDYRNKQKVLNIAKKESIKFVIPSCNDYSYMTASWVAEKMFLPGYEKSSTSKIFFNKKEFKKLCINLLIPSPKLFSTEASKNTKNWIVKPHEKFSGIGIKKIKSSSKDIYDELKKNNQLIEEFIDGSLYSHSAFIERNKIKYDFYVNEFCDTYKYQVDYSHHPSDLRPEHKNTIRKIAEKIIKSMHLSSGLLHTQFLLFKNEIYVLESMRRCPGDLYGFLIEKSSNYNYYKAYLNNFINLKLPILKKSSIKAIARKTISLSNIKTLKSLSIAESIEIFPLSKTGHRIPEAPYGKFGIIFIKLSKSKLFSFKNKLISKVKVNEF